MIQWFNKVLLLGFFSIPLVAMVPHCKSDAISIQETLSVYNNAKVVFHAMGPKFHSSGFEGIDPSQSIEVMDFVLEQFMKQNQDMPAKMRDSILKIQKSLSCAKIHYLTCIALVNCSDELIVHETALTLAEDVKNLAASHSSPPVLFVGGHYLHPEGGSLGGHTASYEVVRQEDGKLSFLINNTVKIEKYHEMDGNRNYQLVYTDLEAANLDVTFWKNVIQTNFMNPVREIPLMDSFYQYVDSKLLKNPNNKINGRLFKRQEVGVCAWKSLSVWLHGKISPGNLREHRDSSLELIYVRLKKCMFEGMRDDFNPDEKSLFLKVELEKKIQDVDMKVKKLMEAA